MLLQLMLFCNWIVCFVKFAVDTLLVVVAHNLSIGIIPFSVVFDILPPVTGNVCLELLENDIYSSRHPTKTGQISLVCSVYRY